MDERQSLPVRRVSEHRRGRAERGEEGSAMSIKVARTKSEFEGQITEETAPRDYRRTPHRSFRLVK